MHSVRAWVPEATWMWIQLLVLPLINYGPSLSLSFLIYMLEITISGGCSENSQLIYCRKVLSTQLAIQWGQVRALCAQAFWLLVTLRTVACCGIFQARILEQLSFPTPGDLSKPEIEPMSLASPALAGRFFTTSPPGKPVSAKKPWLLLLLSAVTSGGALCSSLTNPTSSGQAVLTIKSKPLPVPRFPFLNFKDLIPAHTVIKISHASVLYSAPFPTLVCLLLEALTCFILTLFHHNPLLVTPCTNGLNTA